MVRTILVMMAVVTAGLLFAPALAQQSNGNNDAPNIPTLEEVEAGQNTIEEYIPMDYRFLIGVIGEFSKEIPTTAGPQVQIKTPLISINPSNGDIGVYAKNFPARIAASSRNGQWIVGVAPSSSVEGSSGSRSKECAVSLSMNEGDIEIIEEFPLYSKFQAYFSPHDDNVIYYCVNEPAAVNSIVQCNLKTDESETLEYEGNRFYLYGIRPNTPTGIWASDPFSTSGFPELNLYDLDETQILKHLRFPGASDLVANPSGEYILAMVSNSAEASIGYYIFEDDSFNQVPNLVLTRPTFRWANHSKAIIAKESTSTRDRFLWIDLESGNIRELCSGYFKISFWDISPDDDALVFVVDSDKNPLLYVVPLDPEATAINRIRLRDVSNVSWVGCLKPAGGGGSWLDNLLPF